MKTKSVLMLVVAVAVVAVIATSHFSGYAFWVADRTIPKQLNRYNIEFAVATGQNKLKITQSSCTRTGPNSKGCFKVRKGRAGQILFKFNAASPWELKELKICSGRQKPTSPCSLNVWERMEFAVANAVQVRGETVPGSELAHMKLDGSIDLTGLTAGSEYTEFFLLDVNAIKKDYFYNIEACDGAGTCRKLDPPIINGGRR